MERGRRSTTRNEHGFTVIEGVLAIVVIGLLAIVVVPKILSTDKRAVYITAHQITADMRYARSLAIANFGDYVVKFNPGGEPPPYTSYEIQDPDGGTVKSMEIPAEVTCNPGVGSPFAGELTFTPLGSTTIASDVPILSLEAGGHWQYISIVSATGRVWCHE